MMNLSARENFETSVASAFLRGCTSSPTSDEGLWSFRSGSTNITWATQQIAALLDEALRSHDLREIRAALNSDSMRSFFAPDVFAAAVHTLSDALADQSVAGLQNLVRGCAEIERTLFADEPSAKPSNAVFAFAM